MQLFKFLSRHPFDDSTASAYTDGELPAAEAARFEEHLHACEACNSRVTGARSIRTAVATLPEVSAPRSFAITPEMAASARPAPATRPTPVYVNLVRAGAALSVAAFGVVFAMNTFQTSETTSTASQENAETSPALDAPVPNESAALQDRSADLPTPEPTLGLAPATDSGAGGSGGSTVVPVGSATAASGAPADPTVTAARTPPPSEVPQAPATGPGGGTESQYSTDDPGDDSRNSTVPEGGVITDAVPAEALAPAKAATGQEDEDSNAALWLMGLVAAAAVGALAVIEVTRRRRTP